MAAVGRGVPDADIRMMDRADVYAAIDSERAYQGKWAVYNGQRRETLMEFLAYIQDYVQEAMHQGTRLPDDEADEFCRHSMRKIAALAVAAMEKHGTCMR